MAAEPATIGNVMSRLVHALPPGGGSSGGGSSTMSPLGSAGAGRRGCRFTTTVLNRPTPRIDRCCDAHRRESPAGMAPGGSDRRVCVGDLLVRLPDGEQPDPPEPARLGRLD